MILDFTASKNDYWMPRYWAPFHATTCNTTQAAFDWCAQRITSHHIHLPCNFRKNIHRPELKRLPFIAPTCRLNIKVTTQQKLHYMDIQESQGLSSHDPLSRE